MTTTALPGSGTNWPSEPPTAPSHPPTPPTTPAPPPPAAPAEPDAPTPHEHEPEPQGVTDANPRWARPALMGLLAATAVLYVWGLGASGWANSYYAAAVQAGAKSWKAFLFGSLDA